jgi:16S rRNA G966 N2-methylase RsmD
MSYQYNNKKKSLHHLFAPLPTTKKYTDLQIENDFLTIMTPYKTAREMNQIIITSLHKIKLDRIDDWEVLSNNERASKSVITDMTAGVGGNVIAFSKAFQYVNAIEIDPFRYDQLKYNVKQYELLNINIYNGNSLDYVIKDNMLNQDILYMDPPWGGDDYHQEELITLKISDENIETIINNIFNKKRAQMIVLKLPSNYDMEYFKKHVNRTYDLHELRKMNLIIIY